jgi:hypothetical protein
LQGASGGKRRGKAGVSSHEAVREIINAFEQKTGKQVELVFPEQAEHAGKVGSMTFKTKPESGCPLFDLFTDTW